MHKHQITLVGPPLWVDNGKSFGMLVEIGSNVKENFVVRILFFGYSAMGYQVLEYFLRAGESLVGVITHKDREGENIWFPSVAQLARSHNVDLFFSEDYSKKQLRALVTSLQPEMIFSTYYRKLIPSSILEVPSLGAYNLHGSLLPKYRGRCPTNWQILHGETISGVTLHEMERRADRGAIVGREIVAVHPRETAFSLGEKQVLASAVLLKQVFPLLKTGQAPRTIQDETQATTFGGRRPEDGQIDWNQGAIQIDRLARAVTHPFPGAFSTFRGKKIFFWATYPLKEIGGKPGAITGKTDETFGIVTGEGILKVEKIQLEGEDEMAGAEFWQEYRLKTNEVFGL